MNRFGTRAAAVLRSMRRALGWRGPDGQGVSMGRWLAVAAGSVLLAWLYAPSAPVLVLVPPFFLLSLFWPALVSLRARVASARGARLFEWALVTLVLGAVCYLLYDSRIIEPRLPIDAADNQMWLLRAQLFAEALHDWRWDHWTHLLQGGDSLTDLYPYLFDLFVAVVHVVLPASVSLAAAYTACVLAALVLRGLMVHGLCRRFAGPWLSLAIAVGVLADAGTNIFDGGARSVMYWGLIHGHVALSLALGAMALSVDLLEKTEDRRLVACALLTALAAITHPVAILFLAVWLAALAVSWLMGRARRKAALWAVLALALGLLLPAARLLPSMRALGEHGFGAALGGLEYSTLASDLLKGAEPGGSFALFVGLGLVAVIAAATSRQAALVAAGLASLLFFAHLISPLNVQTGLFDYLPSLLDGQQRRMAALIKLSCLPAVAWLLARAFAHLGRNATAGSLSVRPVLGRALLIGVILLGPVRILGFAADDVHRQVGGLLNRPAELVRGSRIESDQRAVFDWLARARQADPSPNRWRVALYSPVHWRHTMWAEGLRTGVPVADFGWMSGNFLAYRPRELTEQGLRDWNIRFLVTDAGRAPVPGATERAHQGGLWLWEVRGFEDKPVVAPPGIRISNFRLEPDAIRFVVAGAPASGAELVVRSAWFPRWRAHQGDAERTVWPTAPRPDAKPRQLQLGLAGVRDGEVVLTCDGSLPGAVSGMLLTVLAAAALVLVSTGRRRALLEHRLAGGLANVSRQLAERGVQVREKLGPLVTGPRLLAGALLLVVLGGVIVRWRGNHRLRPIGWVNEGMQAWRTEGTVVLPCLANHFEGKLRCGAGITVDSALGQTPIGDSTGEYPRLWPGLRVQMPMAGVLHLRWPNRRLAGSTLELRVSTSGRLRAKLQAGGLELGERLLEGNRLETIALPPNMPVRGAIVMRLEAQTEATLIFDGWLKPSGPAP